MFLDLPKLLKNNDMNNDNYWEKRALNAEEKYNNLAKKAEVVLQKAAEYKQDVKTIIDSIKPVMEYLKFKNGEIDITSALGLMHNPEALKSIGEKMPNIEPLIEKYKIGE